MHAVVAIFGYTCPSSPVPLSLLPLSNKINAVAGKDLYMALEGISEPMHVTTIYRLTARLAEVESRARNESCLTRLWNLHEKPPAHAKRMDCTFQSATQERSHRPAGQRRLRALRRCIAILQAGGTGRKGERGV